MEINFCKEYQVAIIDGLATDILFAKMGAYIIDRDKPLGFQFIVSYGGSRIPCTNYFKLRINIDENNQIISAQLICTATDVYTTIRSFSSTGLYLSLIQTSDSRILMNKRGQMFNQKNIEIVFSEKQNGISVPFTSTTEVVSLTAEQQRLIDLFAFSKKEKESLTLDLLLRQNPTMTFSEMKEFQRKTSFGAPLESDFFGAGSGV